MQLEMFPQTSDKRIKELEKLVNQLSDRVSLLQALFEIDSNLRLGKKSKTVYEMKEN